MLQAQLRKLSGHRRNIWDPLSSYTDTYKSSDHIRRAEALGGDDVMERTGVFATEATHGELPEPLHQVRLQLGQTSPARSASNLAPTC